MRRLALLALILIALFVGLVAGGNAGVGPIVITREDEQKLILFFGDVLTVTEPGIALHVPFLMDVETYDRRWLYLSTEALPIQTRDGEQLTIDNYAIWRIADPVAFKRAFPGGQVDAGQRIDRVIRDDVREVIGRHTLTEVLKDKRDAIMREITKQSREQLANDGIVVADVRINRTELPEGTEESVYARMNAERQRLGRKNRAEGEEQSRRIRAEADAEARIIEANAKRDADILRGTADAEATRIYAEAYSLDEEFYAFRRSLEAYRKTIDGNTTLVTSPRSEFFQFLEGIDGAGAIPVPAREVPSAGGAQE